MSLKGDQIAFLFLSFATILGCGQSSSSFDTLIPAIANKDTVLNIEYLTTDSTGLLKWKTTEPPEDSILVQEFRWNRWITLHDKIHKDKKDNNAFFCKTRLHWRTNSFRLKCGIKYSHIVDAETKREEVRIVSDKTDRIIMFSDTTMYELYNEKGRLLKSGIGLIIQIDSLYKGMYYLNYDNDMIQWVKK